MEERLGAKPVFVQWPIGREDKFSGLIDLIREEALIFDEASLGRQMVREAVPEGLRPEAWEYRQRLIETLAEEDDALMERFVEGQAVSAEEIREALRRATVRQSVVPVLVRIGF